MASTELRRTVSLKLHLTRQDKEQLEQQMQHYGTVVQHVLAHLQEEYETWGKIPKTKIKEKQCHICKDQMELQWQHTDNEKQKICNRCYLYRFSYFRLTKKDYLDKLRKNYPEVGIHGGFYAGIVKYSSQMFKSYMAKLQEREKEIQQLKVQTQTCTNIKQQIKLSRKLKNKEKGIKPLEFRNNVIYLGNASMFDFKKNEAGQYWLGISNPHKLRDKKWYELRLGKKETYITDHNKYEILEDTIKTKAHKTFFGKILKRDKYYEFMFPKRDISHSLTARKDIEEHITKNPSTPVLCLSFGIKTPITLTAMKKGKILEVKTFGNAHLWNWINKERLYRVKVTKEFTKRYESLWKRRKARKRFFRKRGRHERDRIKTEVHTLTKEVITHIRENYKDCVVVMRDTKGIKRINYPPIYHVVLDRWNIELQKTILSYKNMLANFHIYQVTYHESNNLNCSRCGKIVVGEDGKKPVKTLTVKLNHAMNREEILKQKLNQVICREVALNKYPVNDNVIKWLQNLSEEGSKIKEALNSISEKESYKNVVCTGCGHSERFGKNDCLTLHNVLRGEIAKSCGKSLKLSKKKKKKKKKKKVAKRKKIKNSRS